MTPIVSISIRYPATRTRSFLGIVSTKFGSKSGRRGHYTETDIGSTSRTRWRMYRNMLSIGITLLSKHKSFSAPLYDSNSMVLCRLAAEYNLRLSYMKEFHEVFSENSDHADFKPLLQHMKVVDADGASQMDEDQWEAASTLSSIHKHTEY